jgi:hypothetical protein
VLCTDLVETTSNTNTLTGSGKFIDGGDSGGTVYKSNGAIAGILYGIVSAYTSSNGYYTKISYVNTQFGSSFLIHFSDTPQ